MQPDLRAHLHVHVHDTHACSSRGIAEAMQLYGDGMAMFWKVHVHVDAQYEMVLVLHWSFVPDTAQTFVPVFSFLNHQINTAKATSVSSI